VAKPFDPKTLRTPDEARQLMRNAERLNNLDAYNAAFRRLCELTGDKSTDAFERDATTAITAFEEVRSAARGNVSGLNELGRR
jgi:hypothetical protein